MKTKIITQSLIILFVFIFHFANAQDPPPPPPGGGGHGQQGHKPPGGGAPVGSGLFLLMAFGALYGSKKLNDLKKSENKQK